MTELLDIAVLIGNGTTAGVMFCVALSVVPALMAMAPDRYVQAHRLLGGNFEPTMPLIVLTTTLCDVILAITVPERRIAFAVAAALLFGVSLVSHLGNVPINRRVKALPDGPVPEGWQDPRPVWRGWHLLRTALAILALVINSAATVLPR